MKLPWAFLPALAAFGAASCTSVPEAAAPPLAWRLVELEVGTGKQLILEPDEPTGGPARIEIRFSRDRASVGETIEARIHLPGATGRHWIEVAPSRPGVEILGPLRFVVDGPEVATVRFTCATAGRGGIGVTCGD